MKQLILVATVLSFGCKMDDQIASDRFLSGSWDLAELSGGFAGLNEEFDAGRMIWTFDLRAGNVSVENNSEVAVPMALMRTGTYSYDVEESDTGLELVVDGVNLGTIQMEGEDRFLVRQNVRDGFSMGFSRRQD